ncbi:MAG: zinc-ribbon domain-containing protein [Pyrinomonadaceae bacterium]
MSIINCPECGKEVSNTAVACPNCGHPLAPPVLEERTVIREVLPPVVERESFPKWIFVPLAILGAVLIFLLFALFRQDDENQRNIGVNVTQKRPTTTTSSDTTVSTGNEPNQIIIPPSSTDSTVVTVPQSAPPATTDTTITQVPADSENVDKGTLNIEAKVSDKSGGTRAVKAEKFYLLDKDLETILNDADFQPIEGQSLKNSFGLSVLNPGKYNNVRDKALSEINKHIKYDVLTDSAGKAAMKDIKPDSYYLFAITKTASGFAIWSSQISINPGQNVLNLSPERMTEVEP